MKKKDNLIYRNRFIILSFLITAALWIIIYLLDGIGVFGDNTILRMDLYHQYCPLFAELYDKITSGNFSTYSWESGLGSSFWGNYFNYLSSPLGLIVVFFGHDHVPEAIAAMMLLKGAFAAGTFTFYLKKSQHNHSISTATFGVLYSFCAYVLAYYWDIMWLDAVVFLPLVILGIERIINNGFVWTFAGSLALSMFTNYYMAYMICIFSAIYFIYYYIISYPAKAELNTNLPEEKRKKFFVKLKNRRFFRSGVRFAATALLTAGVMLVVLLPTYTILQACSATSSSFPEETKTYFNIFDFFANHIAALETTIRSSGDDVLPNVYCGLVTIILAPLYFFTKSISKKEKIATIGVLGILFISFNLNILNYVWHGFHFPNDLPYRFSFIYSFLLVVIAYKTFVRLNEFTSRQIGLSGAALIAMIIIITKVESKNVDDRSVYVSLILAVIYIVVLTVFKDKKYEQKAVAVIMCVFCVCEVIVADTQAIKNSITASSYETDYDEFTQIKSTLDTIEGGNTSYRMELSSLRTRMDGCWFGYNSASVFSSMAYEETSKLEDRLGEMSNGINSYTYNPQTPIFNMMHSIKYVVDNSSEGLIEEGKYYKKVASTDNFTAYKNKYYLPVAFGVDSDIADWDSEMDVGADYVNPFVIQGQWFEYATGVENVYESIPISYISYNGVDSFMEPYTASSFDFNKQTSDDEDASATFFFKTETAGNVYIYYNVDSGSEKDATFTSGDKSITASCAQDYIVDMGNHEKGETITVNIPFEADSGSVRIYAYTINDAKLKKGYNILSDQTMSIETYEDNLIEGKFTTDKDCILYTSIPYDEGWTVTVDGKEVTGDDYLKIGGGFLGINVSEGDHEVKFEYHVQNLTGSIVCSVFSVIIIIAIVLISLLLKKRRKYCFPAINKSYTEWEIRPEKKAKHVATVASAPVYRQQYRPVPKYEKQIISPPAKPFEKEIIAPPKKFTEEEITEENENGNQ